LLNKKPTIALVKVYGLNVWVFVLGKLYKLIFIGYFPVFHGGRLIGSRDKKNNSCIKLFTHFSIYLLKEKVTGLVSVILGGG
jgi:hypothetical protein